MKRLYFNNNFSKKIGKLSFNDGKTPIELNLNTLDITTNRNYEKNKLI